MKLSSFPAITDLNQIIRTTITVRSRELQMASSLQILTAVPPTTCKPEIITATWNNPSEKFQVCLHINNNLSIHIKGNTQWIEKKGVWNYHIIDEDRGLWPVAFFNNNWWLITLDNGKILF